MVGPVGLGLPSLFHGHAVLGCSLLWIAVAVKQRFKHPRSLIGTEDTDEKIPLHFSQGGGQDPLGVAGSLGQDRAVRAF